MAPAHRAGWVAAVVLALASSVLDAQEWRATAQVGRVDYGSTPAGAAGNANMVLGLSHSAPANWMGVSAALPLGNDPFWAVLAGWKRAQTRGPAGLLLDLSGHGFVQRQPATATLPGTSSSVDGAGAGGDIRAGAYARTGAMALELQGGAAAERSRQGGVVQERFLPAANARLTLARSPLTLVGEARGWWNGSERHAWTGGTVQVTDGPVQLWGGAGRWVAGGVNGVTWNAGGRVGVGGQLELQLAARGNTFDPLYLTATGTTFSLGLSARIGRAPLGSLAPVAPRGKDGRAVIRIAARDAAGAPCIAGDFTNWKPVPMAREGGHWTYAAHLEPGVYHYAFVAANGTWFVPRSVPGRQDDGMGGQTAVLVVTS
jgi:hypothetical protein